ncbi:MAG: cytochrome P450 [Novosphingobium sp.]|nr:MAG: cytochrome P450 [Novosphingobium sp.]
MATLAQPPLDHDRDDRKTADLYEQGKIFKKKAEVVYDGDRVKSILRSPHMMQDVFDAGAVGMKPEEVPLIFLDGKAHRDRRKHITSYFSPRYIKEHFEPLMRKTADMLVADLEKNKQLRIDEVSWQMAVTLVGDLIGVTRGKDREGMKKTAKRIENCLYATKMRTMTGWRLRYAKVRRIWDTMMFWRKDVLPTVKARRQTPQDDVISTLVKENYGDRAILADVMMLCGAGMQTTREFISMVAWHMLEKDYLKDAFLAADYEGKMGILEEILRLDPIVSTLYRRAPENLPENAKGEFTAGTRYGLSIRHANHDPALVGACPHAIDLSRKERLGDQAPMMSFGNGMHRCPGSPLAFNETLFLMDRLLRVPGIRLASTPRIEWEPNVSTFEITNVLVTCD